MSEGLIFVENLVKRYGGRTVLDGVSFTVEPGKFYGLVGKNGAGKSTLMRILMRYEDPDSGHGRIHGSSFQADPARIYAETGYVSEALDFSLPVPVSRIAKLMAAVRPRFDEREFENLLQRFGLPMDRSFAEMSRGQKMQVAFSIAFASRPKLLLLDEFTAVLDSGARTRLLAAAQEYTRAGGTVVMATNIVSEIDRIADVLWVIEAGRFVFNSPVSEISSRFVKLRSKSPGDHSIFLQSACVHVGTNTDQSKSYLLPRDRFVGLSPAISDEFLDRRSITPEEVFIYFTRTEEEALRAGRVPERKAA